MPRIEITLSEEEVTQAIKDYVAEHWKVRDSSPVFSSVHTKVTVQWSPTGPTHYAPDRTCKVVAVTEPKHAQAQFQPLELSPNWVEFVKDDVPPPPLAPSPESTSDDSDDSDIPF